MNGTDTFRVLTAAFSVSPMTTHRDPGELEDGRNWQEHYHGDGNQQKFKRAFSFSDRARYYLPHPAVVQSIELLISNLRSVAIPASLISQYMPMQYTAMRSGRITSDPEDLLLDRICNCIDEYLYATTQG